VSSGKEGKKEIENLLLFNADIYKVELEVNVLCAYK
jgi:hypothetical protein